jgi:hypothetical protein
MSTLSQTDWASVTIYYEVDESFSLEKESVKKSLETWFPNASLHDFRLQYPFEWRKALDAYPEKSLILLNANDDHAMVPNANGSLEDLLSRMSGIQPPDIGLVTHFPEMSGLLGREKLKSALLLRKRLPLRCLSIDFSMGTILVRARLAKEWFSSGRLEEQGRIVRPDNPFGPSVSFAPTVAVVPVDEIFRHLDGYSHAGLFKPIPPLRNVFFDIRNPVDKVRSWKVGHWPETLLAFTGRGVDILSTIPPSSSVIDQARSVVARCKLHWGLRIDLAFLTTIRSEPSEVSHVSLFLGAMTFLSTPVGLRNVIDGLILDPLLLVLLGCGSTVSTKVRKILNQVWYFGASRALHRMLLRAHTASHSVAHRK